MNVASISMNSAICQLPQTAQAKTNDERTESTATRVREQETGKESAVASSSTAKVDLKV